MLAPATSQAKSFQLQPVPYGLDMDIASLGEPISCAMYSGLNSGVQLGDTVVVMGGGSFAVDGGCVLIVCAGDAKIDNAKFKAQFHTKAKMLTFEEAHTMIGHDPGGVCSFALPDNVKTYLDISLKRFETVFPAAGSSNSAIELTCEELEKYSSNFVSWVDVAKGWRPEEKEA